MSETYDAIIIGSGPNGLSAGINLAKKNLNVLIVESKPTIGGGMRTQEILESGFYHDICSTAHPMGYSSPFFNSLDLTENGLKWVFPKHSQAHPFYYKNSQKIPNISILTKSINETCDYFSKEDKNKYYKLFSYLKNNSDKIFDSILHPIDIIPKHPFVMAKFGVNALMPANYFVKKYNSLPAKLLFLGNAAHSILPLNYWTTSAVGLSLMTCGHLQSWPFVEGGSQNLANILANIFKRFGGKISCNTHINKLEDLPKAKAYLFDTNAYNLAKICKKQLHKNYIKKLLNFKFGAGVFKVDFNLNSPIPWLNKELLNAGTIHLGNSTNDIILSEQKIWQNKMHDKPFVLITQPTLFDKTRSPKDKHICWTYCHVPNNYDQDVTELIIKQIETCAPDFRDTIISFKKSFPKDLENYNPNYAGGDIIGGAQNLSQLFIRPTSFLNPYKTSNPKIYLCSSSTPPGGGVHGMCGYNASNIVLKNVFGIDN